MIEIIYGIVRASFCCMNASFCIMYSKMGSHGYGNPEQELLWELKRNLRYKKVHTVISGENYISYMKKNNNNLPFKIYTMVQINLYKNLHNGTKPK